NESTPGKPRLTGRASVAQGGRTEGVYDITGKLVGGDLIMVVNYLNGGTKPAIEVREWGTTKAWKIIPTESDKVKIGANGVDVPSVAPGQGVSPNGTLTSTTVALQFVEFALDLTALNLLPLDPCNPLSTVLFQTRSSPSFTSSLMDYALGTFAIVPPPKADA